jgi:hypothetical protein
MNYIHKKKFLRRMEVIKFKKIGLREPSKYFSHTIQK